MKPATLWFRKTETDFEYNHIEDGHCQNDTPTPKCDIHNKSWKSGKWNKELVHLTDNISPTVVKQQGETNEPKA